MSEHEINLESILETMNKLDDRSVWLLAATMVSCAGQRAQTVGNDDVEEACIDFVTALHECVGTPPLRDLSVQ